MAEQEHWNSEVPANYEQKLMLKRRAEKERRARLAREMRERAAAGGSTPLSPLPQGVTASLAQGATASLAQGATASLAQGATASLAQGATASLAQGATASPRPPVYVKPTKTIPQRNGVAGIALRKTKRKSRKTRRSKHRK
jgi:hypothetical protein